MPRPAMFGGDGDGAGGAGPRDDRGFPVVLSGGQDDGIEADLPQAAPQPSPPPRRCACRSRAGCPLAWRAAACTATSRHSSSAVASTR